MPEPFDGDYIEIRGARQHNLKDVDVLHPTPPADGGDRRQRLGQVDAGLRHPVRRGPAALRRELLDVHAAVPRAHGAAARRAHRRHPAGGRDRSAASRHDLALDGRHDDGAARPPEAAVRAPRRAAMPAVRPQGRAQHAAGDRRRPARDQRRRAHPPRLRLPGPEPAVAGGRDRPGARGLHPRVPPGRGDHDRDAPAERGRDDRDRRRPLDREGGRPGAPGRLARAGAALRQGPPLDLARRHRRAAGLQRHARVHPLRDRVPRPHREPVLVQQPARRLRVVPRLRTHHRSRPRPRDPGPVADARRRRDQAVDDAVDERGAPRPAPVLPPPQDPRRRAVRVPRSRAARAGDRRRRALLRHPRLVPLARAQDVQDARPRPAVALSLLSHLSRLRRHAPQARGARRPDRGGGRSPTSTA